MQTIDYLTGLINAAIAGKTLAANGPVMSAVDHGNNAYTLNPACWLTADRSCVAVWNSGGNSLYGGVLISPRHILIPNHVFGPTAPDTTSTTGFYFRFVAADGTVETRQCDKLQTVPGTDNSVGRFSVDLPAKFIPAYVLPTDWQHYMPPNHSGVSGIGFPCVTFVRDNNPDGDTQGHLATVEQIAGMASFVSTVQPDDAGQLAFFQEVRAGDSGLPTFFLIRNQLALLVIWHGIRSGDSVTSHIASINATILDMGNDGGFTLQTISLDGLGLEVTEILTSADGNPDVQGTWTCPPGVTSIQIEAYGDGGSGGISATLGEGGGGGGEYIKETGYPTVPGADYSFAVGRGSHVGVNNLSDGTIFNGPEDNGGFSVSAAGGSNGTARNGGAGGTGSSAPVHFDGGSGGTSGVGTQGGAGGGGAGPSGAGGDGDPGQVGAGSTGGTAGGGSAGAGGAGGASAVNGTDGHNYGGGGGGGGAVSGNLGKGAPGLIILTYTAVVIDVPTAPSGLQVVASSDTVLHLTWNDNSTDETGFIVERSTNGISSWAGITGSPTASDVVTINDTGLTANTQYYYRVRATNSGGDSANSLVVSAWTQVLADVPLRATTVVQEIPEGYAVSKDGAAYSNVAGPFKSVRGGWNKITILLLCLFLTQGCSALVKHETAASSGIGYVDNIEQEVLTNKMKKDVREAILFNLGKLQGVLIKANNDILTLQDQNASKTNDLIETKKNNQLFGVELAKWKVWTKIALAGLAIAMFFMPALWPIIVKLTSAVIEFVSDRVTALWAVIRKKKGDGGKDAT